MTICGFEKFSMVDYDTLIACTVFTGGCNFRCPFCHNASLVVGNVTEGQIDESEVVDYLQKRKGLVDAVCITGGEPTLHKDLKDFIRKVKGFGYKIKLDTNGTNPDMLQSLLDEGLLDYVAMDIKNSKQKYPLTIGANSIDFALIEKSIEMLKSSSIAYEFRTTLIGELHSEDDIIDIANLIKGAKKYFMQKYKDCDGCISHGYHEISKDVVENYAKIMREKVSFVGIRGY